MTTFHSHSPEETRQFAARLAQGLRPGDVVAYRGPMGAGKTAFTQGLARGLGIREEEVSSPTFALVHEYAGGRLKLYHFDMYRVESFDDLYSTGFFDYLDWGGVLAVEWSENVEGALPPETITVAISPVPDESQGRVITVEGGAF